MSSMPCHLTIRGVPENPAIREINVRSGPNISYPLLVKVAVGMSGLPVLDVSPDDRNDNYNGKTYQWFCIVLPNGQKGWVRDDLVDMVGDGTRFGYPVILKMTYAFTLHRQSIGAPAGQVAVTESIPAPTPVLQPVPVSIMPEPNPAPVPAGDTFPNEAERVRKAAFNITETFEGGGYATYQTYDSGIISYGRFQFTMAAGSFITVMNRYLERSTSQAANELRTYMPRISAKDQGLRNDSRLRELCLQAAQESVMQEIQDEVAVEGFYQPVFELSIEPRGITLPLSQALVFDIAINHGRFNHLIPKTEEVLGVPNKSRLGLNGLTEQTFITKLAALRRDNLYALANKLNLPGLKNRADFWVNITAAGDWNLQGDTGGNLNINGKIVQVRDP